MHFGIFFEWFIDESAVADESVGVRRRNSMQSALLMRRAAIYIAQKGGAVTLSHALPGQAEAPDVK